jgi:Uma2 family endonuclease
MASPHTTTPDIEYPDCDGQPMSDNTLQFQWIVTIEGNLDAIFRLRPDVFVAGDLLWYPVQGHPEIRTAPDALVALGRPKGRRGSYKQWLEGGIPPQVVFEVLSPGNRPDEMQRKFEFYDKYGVQEYYIYDPDSAQLTGWLRGKRGLGPIQDMHGWKSPRLEIRFDLSGDDLVIYRPDGRPFLTFVELAEESESKGKEIEEERRARLAAQRRANRAQKVAEQAQTEKDAALKKAQDDRVEKEAALKKAQALAERLRQLGVDPDS